MMNPIKKWNLKIILKNYNRQADDIMCSDTSYYEQYSKLSELSEKLKETLKENGFRDEECKVIIENFEENNKKISNDIEKEDREKGDGENLHEAELELQKIVSDTNLTAKEKLKKIEILKEAYNKKLKGTFAKVEFETSCSFQENHLNVEIAEKNNRAFHEEIRSIRKNSEGNKILSEVILETAKQYHQIDERNKAKSMIKDYKENNKCAKIMEKLYIYSLTRLYGGTEKEVLAELNYDVLKEDGIEYLIFLPYFRMLASLGINMDTIKDLYKLSIKVPDTVKESDIYAGIVFLIEMGIVTKEEAKMFFNGNDINYEKYLEFSKNLPNNMMNTVYKFKNELPENYKRFASENSSTKK